jgi:spore germination protein KB
VFAHFSQVIFPVFVITLVLNLILTIPHIGQGKLLLILSEGLKPLYFGGIQIVPFAMNFILFIAGLAA